MTTATAAPLSGSTLAVLPNFPFGDQRTEKTADGRPPENADFDCVPESFAKAIQYYDGGYVSGDELKDAEYGETYKNSGTALARYVDNATDLARAKYHVTAVPFNDTNTIDLVGRVHTWLRQGYPVIATIPSQWSNSYSMTALAKPGFSTHVIVFYEEIDGGLGAMNPWGGFEHRGSDAYWQGRLCYGQVWAVVKENVVLDIAHSLGYYVQKTAGNDTAWIDTHGKLEVHGSILTFYRSFANSLLNGLTYLGLPKTLEIFPISGYNGCIQIFERGVIFYDPSRKFDGPPGVPSTQTCYLGHIDNGPAHDWLLAAVQAQLKTVQGQLAQAQADDKTDKATINTLTGQVNTLEQTIKDLQANPPAPTFAQAVKMITDQLHADGKL